MVADGEWGAKTHEGYAVSLEDRPKDECGHQAYNTFDAAEQGVFDVAQGNLPQDLQPFVGRKLAVDAKTRAFPGSGPCEDGMVVDQVGKVILEHAAEIDGGEAAAAENALPILGIDQVDRGQGVVF